MEEKFHAELSIAGTVVPDYDWCVIEQFFNKHHSFKLVLREQPDPEQSGAQSQVDQFIGKTFTASFGHTGGNTQSFRGLITHATRSLEHGQFARLTLSGHSPTILLDGTPRVGSFFNRSIEEILKASLGTLAAEDLPVSIQVQHQHAAGHQLQYFETDFQFLNRLAQYQGEWFYYTGMELQLGRPHEQKLIKLVQGRNLREYRLQTAMRAMARKPFGYHVEQGNMCTPPGVLTAESLLATQHLENMSASHYPPGVARHPIVLTNEQDLESYATQLQLLERQELMKLSAAGDDASVHIGCLVEIAKEVRIGDKREVQALGNFVVTAIKHTLSSPGKYENEFTGVPAHTPFISGDRTDWPIGNMEIAEVTDNLDPAGLGRVRVRFSWPALINDPTDWIRVLTPHAGGSAWVDRNRGLVFIPETGDQVLVAFAGGATGNPVVVGSLFHGRHAAGGQELNHMKSIITRSGHRIELNDSEQNPGITVTDRNGNHFKIDTLSNQISVFAGENMNLSARNIFVSASENMHVRVGQESVTEVGGSQTVHVGRSYSEDVAGNKTEKIGGQKAVDIQGDLIERTGSTAHYTHSGDLVMHSSGTALLLGNVDAKVNKG